MGDHKLMSSIHFVTPGRTVVAGIHAALWLGLFSVCGCSGPKDPTLRISGKVTLNGQPVEHGDIEFGGKVNNGLRRGAMIVKGKYQTAPMQGLLPGEYVVRIFSVAGNPHEVMPDIMPGEEDLGSAAKRDLIPPEYNMRSTQVVKVSAEGPNEFNYDIVTKK